MTDTAKPTPGPWVIGDYEAHGHLYQREITIAPAIGKVTCYGGQDETRVNAELIAEAGTVYHETNLTPRQLVERVRELEAGQKALLSTLKTYVSSMQIIHEPGRSEAINAADAAAKHIIARFEDAALAKHGEGV